MQYWMESSHDMQVEREVPPRVSDAPVIRGYLLRHPLIHFGVTFCFWVTSVSILYVVDAHLLGLFPPRSDSYRLSFALGMAVISYVGERRRLRRAIAQSDPKATE